MSALGVEDAGKLEAFRKMVADAAEPFRSGSGPKPEVLVVSHHDADGICAGAIAHEMLSHIGCGFRIIFVKQLEERVLAEVSKEKADVFLFTDLGSGQLEKIREYIPSASGVKVVICDHHQLKDVGAGGERAPDAASGVYHVNPHLAGFDGKDEISGAGVTWFLASELMPDAARLLDLALVGAAGDVQSENDGEGFRSINRMLQDEARTRGSISIRKGLKLFGRKTRSLHKALEYCSEPELSGISGSESSAVQFLSFLKIPLKKEGRWTRLSDLSQEEEMRLITALTVECGKAVFDRLVGQVITLSNGYELREFATMLNACGRLGKASEGLDLCLGRKTDASDIMTEYSRKIASYLSWARDNREKLVRTKNASYLLAGRSIDDSFIGTVVSVLSRSDEKPVFFGLAYAEDGVKISARAKKDAEGKVNLGDAIRLVAEKLGGEGGGHSLAAGGKIPKGTEEEFVRLVDCALFCGSGVNGGRNGAEDPAIDARGPKEDVESF